MVRQYSKSRELYHGHVHYCYFVQPDKYCAQFNKLGVKYLFWSTITILVITEFLLEHSHDNSQAQTPPMQPTSGCPRWWRWRFLLTVQSCDSRLLIPEKRWCHWTQPWGDWLEQWSEMADWLRSYLLHYAASEHCYDMTQKSEVLDLEFQVSLI